MLRGSAQFSEAPRPPARQADTPKTVLDVGCGIGGTSRYLAKKFPEAQVTGITISEEQIARATALASERGIPNAKFELVDALNMKFADDSFDLVWACESGEHMPDKEKYVQEMARVLKPGGRIAIATWCQREEGDKPFTPKERATLDYLYGEWTHPYFISIDEYAAQFCAIMAHFCAQFSDAPCIYSGTRASWSAPASSPTSRRTTGTSRRGPRGATRSGWACGTRGR